MVTPSYMLTILDEFERQGLDPRASSLQVGIFGAEPWTEQMRQEIEGRMDLDAVDIYGLSEVMGPGVAQECAETKDGLHVWEDHFYPEIIDPAGGRVLPDGETGELVLTSLTKEAMPVIRYRTRDLSALRPGTARPAFRRIGQGRRAQRRHDHLARGERLPHPDRGDRAGYRRCRTALPAPADQAGPDGSPDRAGGGAGLEPAGRRDFAAAEIATRVKDGVGIKVRVEVVDPETLERSAGKMRRVIDQRP